MTTATTSLVWTDTGAAIYLRLPSPNPLTPLGGRLLGYARRLADGTWELRRHGSQDASVYESKAAARDALKVIGGGAA